MSEEAAGSIPKEIVKFFRDNVGEILLIKGPPGSGKTLLGLELMRVLCKRQRGIAIFTRMDSDQLNAEIPWLKDEKEHNITRQLEKMREEYGFTEDEMEEFRARATGAEAESDESVQ